MSTLYLDCFSGIAGDMLVGALLDLGASFEAVRDGLAKLEVPGYELSMRHVDRGPIRAVKFDVGVEHDAAPERGLAEIRALIEPAGLPARVRDRALRAFELLAEAEGRIHGKPADEVHFHEVGAIDAICDVVGAALALEDLDVDAIRVGTIAVGSGYVQCQHGTLPLPAPATLGCLQGLTVRFDERRSELVTPTGACLVGSLAEPGPPVLVIEGVGYGAGDRDPEGVPNVLRAILGRDEPAFVNAPDAGGGPNAATEELMELQANVDHLPPNLLAAAMERVLEAGAVEAFVVPCTMKKGRSGHLLTALVPFAAAGAVENVVFEETGTLGLRWQLVERAALRRSFERVDTAWGEVNVKVGWLAKRRTSVEPEFEDCRRLADEHGVPVAEVMRAARSAARGAEA